MYSQFQFNRKFPKLDKEREKNRKKLALEAAFWRGYIKKVFLKISQNSQENTYARQMQPFRGVLEVRCSENMQQI